MHVKHQTNFQEHR